MENAVGEFKFVLDSGCTDHMINDENLLMEVATLQRPFQVNIADKNADMIVKETGKIPFSTVIDAH